MKQTQRGRRPPEEAVGHRALAGDVGLVAPWARDEVGVDVVRVAVVSLRRHGHARVVVGHNVAVPVQCLPLPRREKEKEQL